MYNYYVRRKEEMLRLLSLLMRIKQFIKVYVSRAWSSILQFGGKKPHKHMTLTFIYKMEIQPYYKHTLFCIVENVDR